MENPRTYGKHPFTVALVHGGPGGAGEMAAVARELADEFGVLEPLQTETSLEGQIHELHSQLSREANSPITLVGFSWGAWLSTLVCARYPQTIKKLILVGSGPFEDRYLPRIQETRLSRLSTFEQAEYNAILALLNDPDSDGKDQKFARLGQLAAKADHYNPIREKSHGPTLSKSHPGNIFHGVLKEAQVLRKNGELLAIASTIQCPVVALHGDYDPHPASGVQVPLSAYLKDFRLIPLEKCGHKPWIERYARDKFYQVLRSELNEP